MENGAVELYTDADIERLKKRIKCWRLALFAVAAAGLAICVTLAALTRTANAAAMELSAVAVSTVFGWVVLYFAIFVVAARRRELGHALMLRQSGRERVEGQVTVTGERLIIVKSIAVRRVEVRSGDQVRRLLAADSRAGVLAEAKASAVYVANGYVAAYEVAK